jgi:hypothetical protein|tara:strand:- start:4500 stop:5441 length:942 start_codon:yes stop_codon:yes gene_type:complete
MSNLDRILELARHGTENAQSQVPAERELKDVPVTEEPTQEAVGEFAEPLYTLQDELGLEDNILVDELARWMDGQDITEFVENFRRHHEMDPVGKSTRGNWPDDDAVKTEELEEAQSPAQKAAFAKMLAAKNGGKDDAVEEAKAKPDYADIDGDGDEKETMKKAAKDKEVKENLQKAEEQIETLKEDCSCGHGSDCDCGPDCKCGCNAVTEETVTEAPTMDTTQLITLLKNSGLSEEAITKKINEWANTPDGAAEEEATSHGEPYENFAQSVNLSLKRYLDAEDFKVGLKEHKVEDIKEAYQEFKGVPISKKKE